MDFDYDVCLSFACEDADCVEPVSEILHAMGMRVFYDKYFEEELVRKNLFTHYCEVYQKKCRYCVMFVSESLKEKLCINYETKRALSLALQEMGHRIVPVRLDDAVIPDITTEYLDFRERNSEYLAPLIVKAIDPDFNVEEMLEYLNWWLNEENKQCKVYVQGTKIIFESIVGGAERKQYSLRLFLEMYRIGELERMFLKSGLFVL